MHVNSLDRNLESLWRRFAELAFTGTSKEDVRRFLGALIEGPSDPKDDEAVYLHQTWRSSLALDASEGEDLDEDERVGLSLFVVEDGVLVKHKDLAKLVAVGGGRRRRSPRSSPEARRRGGRL